MTRNHEVSPGQVRFNVFTEEPTLIVPKLPSEKRFNLDNLDSIPNKKREFTKKEGKPDVAYMNSENLGIIRERLKFKGTDKELTDRLVVFSGNPEDKKKATEIKLDPKKENKRGYTTRLNMSIIAQEALAIDDFDVPNGFKFYQLLGVYRQYKGTGKVSTDKATKRCATVQRSNCPHPDYIYLGEHFFADPNNAIEVKKSKYEKTGYYWKKKGK